MKRLSLFLLTIITVSVASVGHSVNIRASLRGMEITQKAEMVSDLVATELFLRTIAAKPSVSSSSAQRPSTRGLAKKSRN